MKGFYHFLPDRRVQQRAAAKLDEMQDFPREDKYSRRKGDGGPVASGSRAPPAVPQKRKRKADRDREKDLAGKAGPSKVGL